MKRIQTILSAVLCGALVLVSCTRDLENRVSTLESGSKSTADQISVLQKAKTDIESRIAALEGAGYAKAADLDVLRQADTDLGKRIDGIKEELKKYTTTEDMNKTYVNLASYNETLTLLGEIQKKVEGIDSLVEAKVKEALASIETAIQEIKNEIASLKAMIQSVVFVPEYQGGFATVKRVDGEIAPTAAFNFAVTPCAAAQSVADLFAKDNSTVSIEWKTVKVLSKADAYGTLDVKVVSVESSENGIINVVADMKPLKMVFDDANVALCLHIKDTVTDVRSNYVDVEPVDGVEHANCYIAKPGSTVQFQACMGNTDKKVPCDAASLIWQDNNGLVKSVSVADGIMKVELNEALEGNALVAATKDGQVAWSWHIWVTDATMYAYEVAGFQFLDRNIGAVSTAYDSELNIGTIYQWGRKDPFPGLSYTDNINNASLRTVYDASGNPVTIGYQQNISINNLDNAIANPTVLYHERYASTNKGNRSWISTDYSQIDPALFSSLWDVNGTKSVYDPCPAGYKVCSIEAATALVNEIKAAGTVIDTLWDDSFVVAGALVGTNEKYAKGNIQKAKFRGIKINTGLQLYVSGEVGCNTTAETFSFANGVGSLNPSVKFWRSTPDPSFASSKSNFRSYAFSIGVTGNGNYDDISAVKMAAPSQGAYALQYAFPVRCIKE